MTDASSAEWDVYFEAAGHPSSLAQGIAGLRSTGRLIHLGIWDGGEVPEFNWNVVSALKELEIHGSSLGGNQRDAVWQRTIDMLATDPDVRQACERMVTHRMPLEQFREAHEIAGDAEKEKEMESIKIVLSPNAIFSSATMSKRHFSSWPELRARSSGITHVVLIKVKEGTTAEEIERLRTGVLAYKDEIPGIRHMEVGTGAFAAPPNPSPGYDIAIRIQFHSYDDLKRFGPMRRTSASSRPSSTPSWRTSLSWTGRLARGRARRR